MLKAIPFILNSPAEKLFNKNISPNIRKSIAEANATKIGVNGLWLFAMNNLKQRYASMIEKRIRIELMGILLKADNPERYFIFNQKLLKIKKLTASKIEVINTFI